MWFSDINQSCVHIFYRIETRFTTEFQFEFNLCWTAAQENFQSNWQDFIQFVLDQKDYYLTRESTLCNLLDNLAFEAMSNNKYVMGYGSDKKK